LSAQTRRKVLALGGAAVVAGLAPHVGPARAGEVDARIAAFTGGAVIGGSGVTLSIAALVENGVSVPIAFDAPGAEAVLLLAPANPDPQAAIFRFGPRAGSRSVATRVRLAESQTVRVIARFPDGRCAGAEAAVDVVVGGCVI